MKFPYYRRKEDRKVNAFLSIQEICSVMASDAVKDNIIKIQNGDKSAKGNLPAVTWQCTNEGLDRTQGQHQTGFYMVDIDHVEHPFRAYESMCGLGDDVLNNSGIALIHKTPSGKGLRIVARFVNNFPTLAEHQKWLVEKFDLTKWGDFDTVCKDLSRLSFLPCYDYILYVNQQMFLDDGLIRPIDESLYQSEAPSSPSSPSGKTSKDMPTEAECEQLSQTKYKSWFVADIIVQWQRENGTPVEGERHSSYLELCKCFRQLVDNNPRVLFALLPKFTLSNDECWKVCKFSTSRNTSSRFPRGFYFFLVKHGYYGSKEKDAVRAREATPAEVFNMQPNEQDLFIPNLPPIFREFVNIAPKDFKLPVIYSIMPVLGTLTTNYYTEYWDGEEQTTTFMNIIYAPPATGKSYCDRIYDRLTEKMRLRDKLNDMRMALYDKFQNTKSQNEKGIVEPATVIRISQAITSMPQLLTEQRKAQGRHQLVYVHELDTWAKGAKSGGGDKSDMFRVMWENGEYGQNFKSSSTFRGSVRLYLNALITSTKGQINNYFKNVEDGLVTRFSFCEVENQRFAMPNIWKKLTQNDIRRIESIVERLDEELYCDPYEEYHGEIPISELSIEDFDKTVGWKTNFKPKQFISTEEFHPVIIEWLKKQLKMASQELDDARDTWRRRTGTKMCRLALMCKVIYRNPSAKQIQLIKDFIVWWGDMEMRNNLNLWKEKFNAKQRSDNTITIPQTPLFDRMGDMFTQDDVLREASVLNIKTPWRKIKSLWLAAKIVKCETKDGLEIFSKIKPKQ